MQHHVDEELEKAKRALANGVNAETVMQQLAQGLANKVMHHPTSKLKQAGAAGRRDFLALSRELFDIDPDDKDSH